MTVALRGSRVLVTGGARRLGREIALGLAERGANVAISYHSSPEQAQSTVRDLRALGVAADAFAADVARAEQARELVRQAAEFLGGLDVLVHAASGGFRGVPAHAVDEELFDLQVGSTLKGGFFCAQAARAAMGDAGGVIVFITDVAGLQHWPSFAVHGAAKAGLIHLTGTLALAWGPAVRVCGVAPGPVLMPDGASQASQQRSAQETALGRLGRPDDIVQAVAYVIEADYVTGSQVVVDGGRLLN